MESRLESLCDAPRTGKPATYGEYTEKRVLNLLNQAPPGGCSQWNGPLLAVALGDVSDDQVWRILRRRGIQLQRRRRWCITADPEFGAKGADVVGLYLNPPENAVALSVDKKPQKSDQRLQSPATNQWHNEMVRRPGPSDEAGHDKRPRRREFLDFALHPDLQFLVESGGMRVQHFEPVRPARRQFHFRPGVAGGDRRFYQDLQTERDAFRMDQGRGSSDWPAEGLL